MEIRKYEIGEIITIRNDLIVDQSYRIEDDEEVIIFLEGMKLYKGKKGVIKKKTSRGEYLVEFDGYGIRLWFSPEMFENPWDELSKTALTDEEGRLYATHLNPAFAARYAAFSEAFWKSGTIPLYTHELLFNPHLTLGEIMRLRLREHFELSEEEWGLVSTERKLTFEEIMNYPIETATLCYQNKRSTFTKDEWEQIVQKTETLVEKEKSQLTAPNITKFLFPENILRIKWKELSLLAKRYVWTYQPVSFEFAIEKSERCFNALLEQENKMHSLSRNQLHQLREELSKRFDQKIKDGATPYWKDWSEKYIFSEWFLETYKEKMGNIWYEIFAAKL